MSQTFIFSFFPIIISLYFKGIFDMKKPDWDIECELELNIDGMDVRGIVLYDDDFWVIMAEPHHSIAMEIYLRGTYQL